jgi:gamma-glutamyltranspeptidase/glutathione hydrolase
MSRLWFSRPARLTVILVLAWGGACHVRPPAPPPAPAPPVRQPNDAAPQPDASQREEDMRRASAELAPVATSASPLPDPSLLHLPSPDPTRLTHGTLNVAWGRGVQVQGTFGVVTSVEAHATRAGIEVLSQGGNAVDAAVATALALAVTPPSAGNLAGGGLLPAKVGAKVDAIDLR